MTPFTCFMDDPGKRMGIHESLCVLPNEFPVFPLHVLLVPAEHRESLQVEDLASAASFVRRFPDYLAFHNMRYAGASRPEHLHFQAVPGNHGLPLLIAPRRELASFRSSRLSAIDDYPACALVAEGSQAVRLAFAITKALHPAPFNLVLLGDTVFVIPRTKETPDGFSSQFAALEMAGCVVVVDRDRYEALSHREIDQAISECGFAAGRRRAFEDSLPSLLRRSG
jgi:ATP adenylyltransferase/5',5'''-P-1,P-4-tetraphosphate phosphorylase II